MTGDKILSYFFEPKKGGVIRRGDLILAHTEEPKGVWYIRSGYVRQSTRSEKGHEVSFHIFKPGSVFPLMWLMSESENRYAYDAMTECELVAIPRKEFMSLLDRHPELISYFSKRFILGMDGLLTRLESLIIDDVETRIMKLFTYFGRSFSTKNEQGAVELTFPLTHHDIASWIGAARETTTLALRKLKKQRLLTSRGKYYRITSLERLNKTLRNPA